VGACTQGDHASAKLRRDSNGVYILDLTLPRGLTGEKGAASTVPGIQGRPGKDAEPISLEDTEKIVRRIVLAPANVEKFRGPVGQPGQSITGEPGQKGDVGMTREEMKHLIVSILSDVGVLSEHARKLVEVRVKLRQAINKADSRNFSTFSELVKECDKVLDAPPPVDVDALRRENEALKKQLEEKKP